MKSEPLINTDLIDSVFLKDAPWSEGHGASPGHLGSGLLYYGITYALRARLCICIGSGGGFVPRVIRQAQRDMNGQGETHLIDANLPESGWGSPQWLDDQSFFRKEFPDILVHLKKSSEVLPTFERHSVDYIHVDGDHSYEGCQHNVELSLPLLSQDGVMTLHDTSLHTRDSRCGVHRVVAELRSAPQFDVVDLPFIGRGLAIVRPIALK